MSRSAGAETRRRLMAQVLKIIDLNPNSRIEKIEAIAGINVGVSPKKVREYVRQFVLAGQVEKTEKGFKFVKP